MHGSARSLWILGLGLAGIFASATCTSENGEDEAGEETTGTPACDPRPGDGELYSSCTGVPCSNPDHICAFQVGMSPLVDPAYCTDYCTIDTECPPVGDCTATPLCLTPSGGGSGVCALDCADGKQCPEGMQCLEDEDNGAIRYLCF